MNALKKNAEHDSRAMTQAFCVHDSEKDDGLPYPLNRIFLTDRSFRDDIFILQISANKLNHYLVLQPHYPLQRALENIRVNGSINF